MLSQFTQWFAALSMAQQVYWSLALVATAIFVVQFVLTFVGLDSADAGDLDVGADFDGDTMDNGGGLSLFSIRSLINFFVGFGWSGICLEAVIPNSLLLALLSLVVGLGFAFMVVYIWRRVRRLEHNGAVRISDALGKTATVYLRIPARQQGTGKVQISLGGSVHEYAAVTLGDELATGHIVRITAVNAETSTLTVEAV